VGFGNEKRERAHGLTVRCICH